MKLSNVKKSLPEIWFLFAFGVGAIQLLSLIFSYDPFLIERVLSLALSAGLLLVLFRSSQQFVFKRSKLTTACCLLLVLLFLLFKSSTTYPAPFASFLFLLIITLQYASWNGQMSNSQIRLNKRIFRYLLLVLSILFISQNKIWFQLGDRFVGFFGSPTTFATWLAALFLFCYFQSPSNTRSKNKEALICWIVVSFFVYTSGTRVNLIFMIIALALIFNPLTLTNKSRALIITINVILIFFVYPIYTFLSGYVESSVLAFRYSDGADTSFGLRSVLFSTVFENFINTGTRGILFGNGAESSRDLIKTLWGADLYPHNDILRIMYDFGVFFVTGFTCLIVYLGSRNTLAMLLTMLYVFSFLHNMIYSPFLIALIVTASTLSTKKYQNKHQLTLQNSVSHP